MFQSDLRGRGTKFLEFFFIGTSAIKRQEKSRIFRYGFLSKGQITQLLTILQQMLRFKEQDSSPCPLFFFYVHVVENSFEHFPTQWACNGCNCIIAHKLCPNQGCGSGFGAFVPDPDMGIKLCRIEIFTKHLIFWAVFRSDLYS